ncbi:MAG: hypothetical protein BMS9Abin03_181 [Thermodesulfobacteriota bacterium]|nr:MAG: hypothetical protein BMS9Abin03_181 [Thermodesulfobacteriota bacterium]
MCSYVNFSQDPRDWDPRGHHLIQNPCYIDSIYYPINLKTCWKKNRMLINIIFLEIAQDLGYQKNIYSMLSSTGMIHSPDKPASGSASGSA